MLVKSTKPFKWHIWFRSAPRYPWKTNAVKSMVRSVTTGRVETHLAYQGRSLVNVQTDLVEKNSILRL